jgi:hypothetical protein
VTGRSSTNVDQVKDRGQRDHSTVPTWHGEAAAWASGILGHPAPPDEVFRLVATDHFEDHHGKGTLRCTG